MVVDTVEHIATKHAAAGQVSGGNRHVIGMDECLAIFRPTRETPVIRKLRRKVQRTQAGNEEVGLDRMTRNDGKPGPCRDLPQLGNPGMRLESAPDFLGGLFHRHLLDRGNCRGLEFSPAMMES